MKKFFITILILAILLAIPASYIGGTIFMKTIRADRATEMSHKYVANLYTEYQVIGENCQGEDTNSDSYVSCDIRISKSGDIVTEKVLNLSCPTMWKSYTGNTCKERTLGVTSE